MAEFGGWKISCPWCGRLNDCHDAASGATPEPGDLGICWGCRRVAVFERSPLGVLYQRRATPAEQQDAQRELAPALAAMAESYTPHEAVRLLGGEPHA